MNQHGYAAKVYHEMIGEEIEFKRIASNNKILFYFTDEDVDRIFSVITNLKHLAMLQVLFYGCLRASELCQLNDEDVDFKSLILRINGKGGQEGLCYIGHECANTLSEYLKVRPSHLVEGDSHYSTPIMGKDGDGWTFIVCLQLTRRRLALKNKVDFMFLAGILCDFDDCQRVQHKNCQRSVAA